MAGIRYRAPLPPSSAIISREGYLILRDELDELYVRKRPEVVSALSDAAAEGDRSENAEYIYRKKQLGEIDRRVRYLSKRLKAVKVVDALPFDRSKIYFGALITLEDDDGKIRVVRIVGPDETSFPDAAPGCQRISIDAPLALALAKKQQGDDVSVALPGGVVSYFVTAIDY